MSVAGSAPGHHITARGFLRGHAPAVVLPGRVSCLAGRLMKLALLVGALCFSLSAAAAGAGPCAPGKHRRCVVEDTTIDFSAVPDISKQIVAAEPAPPPIKPAVVAPPAPAYNGPTVGLAPLPRAPTIGYKWSLE
jgi:hypothetical protein